MCGIAGFLDRKGQISDPLPALRRMGIALEHRGPDCADEWFDERSRIGLAHRRLAIVDLSVEGAQPMRSACGRWMIVFNGEIYNYRELRLELEKSGKAPSWRGHSDTEVMLAAVSAWGIRGALERFNGMFALALWDNHERKLTLARDRFGEKPLYYGWCGATLAFASQLKAMQTLPGWSPRLRAEAVAQLMRFSYVPGPGSIYEGICKLPPGSLLTVPADLAPQMLPEPEQYWSALEVATAAYSRPLEHDVEGTIDRLSDTLDRAVKQRMHADVPLGAFLSGGVDSSIVVASMQAQSSQPIRTFSVGFTEAEFDESAHARAVAAHLGTDHTEFMLAPADALALVPRLPAFYDEPFADSSQIPTCLVAACARRHVTVCLSGDGGDELFGGYNRHQWGPDVWRRLAAVPRPLRLAAARAIHAVPVNAWSALINAAGSLVPAARQRLPGYKMHKLAGTLSATDQADFYRGLASFWREGEIAAHGGDTAPLLLDESRWPAGLPFAELMMAVDAVSYLPDDILVKLDRASMAVSLEGRVPFLDADLFELAWRIPPQLKIRGRTGKWILRQALYRRVPQNLIDRPKMGFGVPIDRWLRGPLRDWAQTLLSEAELRKSGFFEAAKIRRVWERHLAGHGGYEYHLWNVLMFQSWLQYQAHA